MQTANDNRGRKRFFGLVKAAVVSLLLVQATTFGWNLFNRVPRQMLQDDPISDRLKQTVVTLSERIGIRDYEHYEALNQTASYIEEQFKQLGYSVAIQEYEVEGKKFRNVIAGSHQSHNSQEVIIVGAHYDSCHNPGADDNASGIAGLLELARQLKNTSGKFPIWFVAFTNEEPPFFTTPFMGSRVFTKMLKAQGQKVKAAVILEMIGYYSSAVNSQRYLPLIGLFYPNRANFIAVVSDFSSRHIKNQLIRVFKKTVDFPVEGIAAPRSLPGIYFSDHWSFWQENYPAIMVTDTAYLRNSNYHKPTDLHVTLDYVSMSQVVRGLKSAIEVMVNE